MAERMTAPRGVYGPRCGSSWRMRTSRPCQVTMSGSGAFTGWTVLGHLRQSAGTLGPQAPVLVSRSWALPRVRALDRCQEVARPDASENGSGRIARLMWTPGPYPAGAVLQPLTGRLPMRDARHPSQGSPWTGPPSVAGHARPRRSGSRMSPAVLTQARRRGATRSDMQPGRRRRAGRGPPLQPGIDT